MNDDQLARARRMWALGQSTLTIALCLRITEACVYNWIGKIKGTGPDLVLHEKGRG